MQVCRVCDKRGTWSGAPDQCPACRGEGNQVRFCRDCGRPSTTPQCDSCHIVIPSGPVEIIRPPATGSTEDPPRNPAEEIPSRTQGGRPSAGSYRDMLRRGEAGRVVQDTSRLSNPPAPIAPPQNAPTQHLEVHHHHYSESPRHSGPPEQMPCEVCKKPASQHSNTLYCSKCNKVYGWHTVRQYHFHCLGCGNKLQ